MARTRILIVDDAVVVRRLLSDAIASDPDLEVVGTAANGLIALAKIPLLNPDLVILDLEMPELDGRQTLLAIRQTRPGLPVLMFSALTGRGAPATLELLALGASDYVPKPANFASLEAATQCVRAELIPKIKALCIRHVPPISTTRLAGQPARRAAKEASAASPSRVDIVAIGASTGGPFALSVLLPALPADFAAPIVVVQHMPPTFTKLLAERLEKQSAIAVREAANGEVLSPGTAWIAPGDQHMALVRQGASVHIQLHQGSPENSCRPAVDVLFRSVADIHAEHALAVVLTGMGQDGLRGCEHIRQAGGQIVAQDEPTSVVWGMPGHVARAGLADLVLPLDQIGPELTRRVALGRGRSHKA